MPDSSARESQRQLRPSQRHELKDPLENEKTMIRMARGTPAPMPNVIPMTKPRALAAGAVTIVKNDYEEPAGTLLGMAPLKIAQVRDEADTIPSNMTRLGIAPADIAKAVDRVNAEAARRAAPANAANEPVVRFNPPVATPPGPVTAKVMPLPPPVADAPANAEAKQGDHKWQNFEDLGLAPNKVTKKAQKLVVSGYRLLGFGILTTIVVVLLAYIAMTVFYFLNHTWITPVEISANDDKVVALQSQLAAQQNERAKLVSELDQADRAIAAEQSFQHEFAKAIKKDLDGRRQALGRVQQLAHTAAATRDQIKSTNGDYSDSTVKRMKDEYDAGLIDRNQMLAGKFQLAQITNSSLSLAERQAEFDQRAQELSAETQSLDAILADKTNTSALSYDVLKIQRDYDASKLELAKDMEEHDRIKASIERQDLIIKGLKDTNYLRAITDKATVALVPYSNLDKVSKGTSLYACKASMVMCHEVGKVIDILPGEVPVKHPHRDALMRGRMVELQMTDGDAAQDDVLFLGGAPLGI